MIFLTNLCIIIAFLHWNFIKIFIVQKKNVNIIIETTQNIPEKE